MKKKAGGRDMAQATRNYDFDADKVYEALVGAIKRVRRVKRYSTDATSRTVTVRMGMTLSSWGQTFVASVRDTGSGSAVTVSWTETRAYVRPGKNSPVTYGTNVSTRDAGELFEALSMELNEDTPGAMARAGGFYGMALAWKGNLAWCAIMTGLLLVISVLVMPMQRMTMGSTEIFEIFEVICIVCAAPSIVFLICGIPVRAGIRKAKARLSELENEAQRMAEQWEDARARIIEDMRRLGYETEDEIIAHGEETREFREWQRKAEEINKKQEAARIEVWKRCGRYREPN